ncbi:MAG: IMP dehydrogenase, partial [Methyloceanibacter sp.]|uniref:IMP dehydrogenase n=1 Tax=Methyloceanibacter sp. TaxID=1965321 RepID=UPI003D9AECA2
GIIHKNMSPAEQAGEVRRVKKFESGIVNDPITVGPGMSVRDVIELTRRKNISGVPVVDGQELIGIATHRDLRFETALDASVTSVMTPKDRLVTVREGAGKDEVLMLLHKHRIEKVLVVDEEFRLRGMITAKDFQKAKDYPGASKDARGALRAGAAVGTGNDTDERVAALVEAGVDVIVVDTSHGHTRGVIERVRAIRADHPDMQIIAGNVVTAEGALALVDAGVNAVKVGIGPGSICTTRIVAGVGVPQFTALLEAVEAAQKSDIPVISDGGTRYSGDLAKALAAGADCVMLGSLLAGTDESPGEVFLYQGRSYKAYRGMGSIGAMSRGSADRYFQQDIRDALKLVPEGVEGQVPYKGPVASVLHQLIGGLRASMGYAGAPTLADFRARAEFIRISAASFRESHVHDVTITRESPNYPREG